MANIRCCYKCEKRAINCHSTCENYRAAVIENERVKSVKKEYFGMISDSIESANRHNSIKKKQRHIY